MRVSRLAPVLEEAAPPIPSPDRRLEQYTTPAEEALKIAVHLSSRGHLDETIVDLAAGTCRLALAALLAGAPRAVAVDADPRLAGLCMQAARRLDLEGRLQPVTSWITRGRGPLSRARVIMSNPPWGVWRRGADWEILSYALSLRPSVVIAILKSGNIAFHKEKAREHGYTVRLLWSFSFPVPASMPGHRSRVRRFTADVVEFTPLSGVILE